MHAISKRTLLFIDYTKSPQSKHTLKADPAPQEVPDWVRELDQYKDALKAGELKEVEFLAPGAGDEDRAAAFLRSRGYEVNGPAKKEEDQGDSQGDKNGKGKAAKAGK
jgi:hypothetical protein